MASLYCQRYKRCKNWEKLISGYLKKVQISAKSTIKASTCFQSHLLGEFKALQGRKKCGARLKFRVLQKTSHDVEKVSGCCKKISSWWQKNLRVQKNWPQLHLKCSFCQFPWHPIESCSSVHLTKCISFSMYNCTIVQLYIVNGATKKQENSYLS